MATVRADQVEPGQTIVLYGQQLQVTRVDHPFLGRDEMRLFVESTERRWHCLVALNDTEVEVAGTS